MNKQLLRRTMAVIDADPKHWQQSEWKCGSRYCFAGHAAMLAGWKFVRGSQDFVEGPQGRLHIQDAATYELGLNEDQAFDLFSGGNTRKDLREKVDELCGGIES